MKRSELRELIKDVVVRRMRESEEGPRCAHGILKADSDHCGGCRADMERKYGRPSTYGFDDDLDETPNVNELNPSTYRRTAKARIMQAYDKTRPDREHAKRTGSEEPINVDYSRALKLGKHADDIESKRKVNELNPSTYKRAERKRLGRAMDAYDKSSIGKFSNPPLGMPRVSVPDFSKNYGKALKTRAAGDAAADRRRRASDHLSDAKKLSVPDKHATRIAKDTLKMNPAMRGVMGGPSKDDSIALLKKHGMRVPKVNELRPSTYDSLAHKRTQQANNFGRKATASKNPKQKQQLNRVQAFMHGKAADADWHNVGRDNRIGPDNPTPPNRPQAPLGKVGMPSRLRRKQAATGHARGPKPIRQENSTTGAASMGEGPPKTPFAFSKKKLKPRRG